MKLLLSILMSFLLLNSCVYNKEKIELPSPEITYTNYAKNIVGENCLACHISGYNTNGTPAGNRNFTTYQGVKQAVDDGVFKQRVIDGVAPTMPYGLPQLSQEIKDKLTLWINQGAKE
ncbi:MAG: hypothetical protein A3K10_00055 [Bacteroidetes bacterium RIFCSPLOWO2_12_FULL_31_6]|nr:MAG: hypothetical protein A3K10_00055 [Bacteroidetes bacterium RIFCSPLOWO2_12_FULL_31_6]